MKYNSDLKLKISRGAEETAKILTKKTFRVNLGSIDCTILRFWGPSNSTILKSFRSPSPSSSCLTLISNSESSVVLRGPHKNFKKTFWKVGQFNTNIFWFQGPAKKMNFRSLGMCIWKKRVREFKKLALFFLSQKVRELEHFKISKISKIFLKVGYFSRFCQTSRKFESGCHL